MSQGFDKTWGARNVLCRRNNLQIKWNWKRQRRHVVLSSMEIVLVVWGLSLAGGVGVVLGWRVRWVVLGGVGCCFFLCGGVPRPRPPASPQRGRAFLALNSFGVGFVGLMS